MTVLRQELIHEHDKQGTITLKTTYDTSEAMRIAKEVSESSNGGKSDSNNGMRPMGYIPPEMWSYDPWLIMAKKGARAGDMGEYTKYVKKFFEVHPEFAVLFHKKYF